MHLIGWIKILCMWVSEEEKKGFTLLNLGQKKRDFNTVATYKETLWQDCYEVFHLQLKQKKSKFSVN